MNGPIRRVPVYATVVLTALATLALAPSVGATYPGRNGLIAFHANVGDEAQIFTVRSNGHELRQITDVDGVAGVPDWSPTGARSRSRSTSARWPSWTPTEATSA